MVSIDDISWWLLDTNKLMTRLVEGVERIADGQKTKEIIENLRKNTTREIERLTKHVERIQKKVDGLRDWMNEIADHIELRRYGPQTIEDLGEFIQVPFEDYWYIYRRIGNRYEIQYRVAFPTPEFQKTYFRIPQEDIAYCKKCEYEAFGEET